MIITASDQVTFNDSHSYSGLAPSSVGVGGNIEISTSILEVLNRSELISDTHGQGNAGDVIITASDRVTIDNSFAFSGVEPDGTGAGGDIEISTPILEVLNRGYLDSSIYGQGNGGNVTITANKHVTFNLGFVWSSIDQRGKGSGGNIEITTPILEVLNGARLSANVNGQGNGGSVIITASDRVTFQGTTRDGRSASGAFISVKRTSNGSVGDIKITAPVLEIIDGAGLIADTHGPGDTGRIIITASERVLMDGVGLGGFISGIFANTFASAAGGGNDVIVTTPDLQISNGAMISARNGQC